ncbi:MFS transporter [Actinomadura barringtoniae]|uniref:MFS transporter n=1 Tax=Actinomadura barringtoniae TaxID=1427535 RepID=A0A939PL89_9ACTN|nr:MFS transporter [Actinomadura barringtoniae]MBO2454385.1 MFS transporter [Actinomadura barringtoniae]
MRKGLALSLLVAVQFVLILDASIVNVALPAIGRDLHFDQADLSWVANAYTLTFGGFLLLGGRAADLAGRRLLFMSGLALFTASSLAGALSPNSAALVGARAAQGLGAALVAPAALALIMTLFESGAERNRALGLFGAVAGAGGATGAILGGLLTDWFGWEAVLLVNVPIGAAAIALAPVLLPEAADRNVQGFDLFGALTITAGLALLVYALVDANNRGWTSPQTYTLIALALFLVITFITIEARAQHPLVPLRIFRDRTLLSGNVIALLTTMAIFPMFFVLTLYLQQILGYGPIKAGLGQLPIALAIAAGAALGAQLVSRLGARIPITLGLALAAAGLAWFSQISPNGAYLTDVLGPSLITGIGGGILFVATTIAATTSASASESGLASGVINTTQQIGGALGLAMAVAVSSTVTGHNLTPQSLNDGFQAAVLTSAAIALAGIALAQLLTPPRYDAERTEEPHDIEVSQNSVE